MAAPASLRFALIVTASAAAALMAACSPDRQPLPSANAAVLQQPVPPASAPSTPKPTPPTFPPASGPASGPASDPTK